MTIYSLLKEVRLILKNNSINNINYARKLLIKIGLFLYRRNIMYFPFKLNFILLLMIYIIPFSQIIAPNRKLI